MAPNRDQRPRRWPEPLPGPWILRSLGHALAGFAHALTNEPHTQFLLLCGAVIVALGAVFRLSVLEWALVILAAGVVLAAELANTAIEAVVDLASPARHPLAKRAKDVAAAAVFVSILVASAVGLLVFLPHFLGRR